MHKFLVMGLIGEEAFTDVLIGLPDEFYKFEQIEQDAVWKAILGKIDEGIKDIDELVSFAIKWIKLYRSMTIIY